LPVLGSVIACTCISFPLGFNGRERPSFPESASILHCSQFRYFVSMERPYLPTMIWDEFGWCVLLLAFISGQVSAMMYNWDDLWFCSIWFSISFLVQRTCWSLSLHNWLEKYAQGIQKEHELM
jgi:hypothetical protein